VAGVVALLVGAGLLVAGTSVAILGGTARDDQGFYMTPTQSLATDGYAIVSDTVHLGAPPGSRWLPESLLGRVKITARGPAGQPLFVGVARSADVSRYLEGVSHSTVTDLGSGAGATYRHTPGARRPVPPVLTGFWAARTRLGQTSMTWSPSGGDWTVVVMNRAGSAPVAADVSVGATLPAAGRFVAVTLVAGTLFLLLGLGLLIGALLARRSPTAEPGTARD
jgi:hypothetical protein